MKGSVILVKKGNVWFLGRKFASVGKGDGRKVVEMEVTRGFNAVDLGLGRKVAKSRNGKENGGAKESVTCEFFFPVS